MHDTVIGRLSTATGDDAEHLRKFAGDFEYVALGKLHKTLLARGYKPLATKTKCTLKLAWTDVAKSGGWHDANLQLDVGRVRPTRLLLGTGSIERRGDQWLRIHVMKSSIAIFAIVPSCAGPPPGYFGADDGGDCYKVDTPHALAIADSN